MTDHLYRVVMMGYPAGALIPDRFEPDYMEADPNWEPPNWNPDDYWVDRYGHGESRFFWPSTQKEYHSKSSAQKRKKLIESYGGKCIVQQSSLIRWPEHGKEIIVPPPPRDEVADAITTLVNAGLLRIDFGSKP